MGKNDKVINMKNVTHWQWLWHATKHFGLP